MSGANPSHLSKGEDMWYLRGVNTEDEWIIHYKTIPCFLSSTFCQRLLGVRPRNLRTLETTIPESVCAPLVESRSSG